MTPRRILVVFWLGFLLFAYPGYLNQSGFEMLIDARYHEIADSYSPMLTMLFGIVEKVFAGPPALLLVQSGALLFGAYALLRRAMSDRNAAITAGVLLVFPPVMSSMTVISEDAMLASSLVCAAALFASERRRVRLAGLLLVVIACGLREGAWLAAAPIVVGGFVWHERPLMRYAIAVNAWIACVLLALGIEYLLVDLVTRDKDTKLAMTDVAGTIAHARELSDSEITALAPSVAFAPGAGLQQRARLIEGKPAHLAVGPGRLFEDDKHADALIDARSQLRSAERGAYLLGRWAQWRRLLLHPTTKTYTRDVPATEYRYAAAHASRESAIQKPLHKLMRMLARTPLFSPIVYLLVALVILPLARGRARLLLASGVLLVLALAFVTWDAEYRYATWPIVATVLGTVMVFLQRRDLRHREDRAKRPLEVDADRPAVPVE
jgi:hypothetical protein